MNFKKIIICSVSIVNMLPLVGCSSGDDTNHIQPDISVSELNVDNTNPISNGNRVIYELNLTNFTTEGTLEAATEKITDLDKLGIDIIWLMPIHPRGTTDRLGTLGSPYAPKDYYAVNEDYGTQDDLKAFVQKAHQVGIEVWLDWVPNHTSTDAAWTVTHPEYYEHQDGDFVHPSNYGDVYQLNMRSATTQRAMLDAMKYWIDQADIDGFRCDYISSPSIPESFWSMAIEELKSYKDGKNITMLGEADFNDVPRLYGKGFDFDYAWGFNTKLQNVGSSASSLREACETLVNDTHYGTDLDRMVYLTNHDMNAEKGSVFSVFKERAYPLTVLTFTLYGMPLLYNGQEIGCTKQMGLFDKATISWNKNDINTKMNNTIRTLIALKHTQKALANGANRGSVAFLETDKSSVFAFSRKSGDNEVLTIINLGAAATASVRGITAGKYEKWIDSSDIASGTKKSYVELSATSPIELESYGYAVYVK